MDGRTEEATAFRSWGRSWVLRENFPPSDILCFPKYFRQHIRGLATDAFHILAVTLTDARSSPLEENLPLFRAYHCHWKGVESSMAASRVVMAKDARRSRLRARR